MQYILEENVVNYYALCSGMKYNNNLIHQIIISLKLNELRDDIITSIDNSVLDFGELYKLLKKLERKLDGDVQFKICKYYFQDKDFAEQISLDGLKITKKGVTKNFDVIFKECDFKWDVNICECEEVSYDYIEEPDTDVLLQDLEIVLGKDFNKLANMIIAYLFKKLK